LTKSPSGSSPELNQVLHWNGIKWTLANIPEPASTHPLAINFLRAVGCTSDRDCWAVGQYTKPAGTFTLNQAMHWNGRRWSVATIPNPGGTGGTDYSVLFGVSCTSPGNCWAVGRYGNSTFPLNLNQALHWNGSKWAKVTVFNPDGTGGFNTLSAVTCTSATNCWAVGYFGNTSGGGMVTNQALHWNGHRWSQAPTPNPGGGSSGDSNLLFAVRCGSAKLCWAVGFQEPNGGAQVNQALRWNGSHWLAG
jgi:hypothetical protein